METINFRTPQKILPKKNVSLEQAWNIGIDIGYGGVKGYAPNKYFCIPSYVKKMDGEMLQAVDEADILLEDETGVYLVGQSAQDMVTSDDTSDTEAEAFTRNRYGSKKFEILALTGLGIGLMNNHIRQRPKEVPVIVQTGLPTAYMVKRDIDSLTRVFKKDQNFRMRIGSGQWKEFHVNPEEVHVMAQPSGTLYSVLIDEEGKYVADAKKMLLSNLMIVDAGYGTFDPYGTISRKIMVKESIPGLGMLRIMQKTTEAIYKDLGEDIQVAALPKYLAKGYVTILDEVEMKTEEVPLLPYLEKANQEVCMESIKKLKEISNYLRDYSIMVITGGTGAAWYEQYKEHFAGMKELQVLPGNRNDGLPMIYSNVRGYYMFRYMAQKAGIKGGRT